MAVGDHFRRARIWTGLQHPYRHVLSEFSYSNPAVPGVTDPEAAFNYLFSVIYPNYQGTVATPGDLPGVASINDYYRVDDDGDGKVAGYVYQRIDGVEQWIKRYDIDWAADTILSDTIVRTQYLYVSRFGATDRDENGVDFAGDLAGQRIYGGDQANQHLILYANSGDAVGNTGYVQFGDDARPLVDNTFDLGTATYRFISGYFATSVIVGTTAYGSASITDTSGTISFGDENLTTTGIITGNQFNVSTFMEMTEIATPANASAGTNRLYFKADGLLYRLDEAGVESLVGLSFTSSNDNRVVRSDGATGTAIQESLVVLDDAGAMSGLTQLDVDDIRLDGSTISTTLLNADLNLSPNGSGLVVVPGLVDNSLTQNRIIDVNGAGRLQSTNIVISGAALSAITQLDVDNLRLDGNTLSSTDVNGNIVFDPNGTGVIVLGSTARPDADDTHDLGTAALRFQDLYLSGTISDGTNAISTATLLSLRDALTGVVDGAALFYDNATGRWLPSLPDSEIDHGTLTGILDDDHTQYALLAGRAGGQTLIGGTAANNDLTLESTSNATKGFVKFASDLAPSVDASFAAGWSGTDIGDAAFNFRDVYTKGEFFGFRFQNTTFAGLPAASAQNTGRSVYATDTESLYVDTGGTWKQVGRAVYRNDEAFDGIITLLNVDVSGSLQDARNAIFQLLDNNNDFERVQAQILATSATNVRIVTNVPLPAGSYRLIGIE